MKKFRDFISIFLLLFVMFVETNAQENLPRFIPSIDTETHDKLLNLLFPLDALKTRNADFVLILRLIPSFENDSQIIIVGKEGKGFVTEFSSTGNVWSLANDIYERTGNDDPVEIAKQIEIRKREIVVPVAQIHNWRDNLIESVSAKIKSQKSRAPAISEKKFETVILDGTKYELYYSFDGGEIRYSHIAGSVDKIYPTDAPFVKWIKVIRRELGKQQESK